MHRIEKAAVVPYGAMSMFELVADVESYPGFLPGCTGSRVTRVADDALDASLQISVGPFRHWFTTRNTLFAPERISLALLDGPFRALEGEWRFTPGPDGGTRVSLALEFDFAARVVGRALAPAFFGDCSANGRCLRRACP